MREGRGGREGTREEGRKCTCTYTHTCTKEGTKEGTKETRGRTYKYPPVLCSNCHRNQVGSSYN